MKTHEFLAGLSGDRFYGDDWVGRPVTKRIKQYFSDKDFVESPSADEAANWFYQSWAMQDAPGGPIYIAWDLAKDFENPLKKLRPKIRREGCRTLD